MLLQLLLFAVVSLWSKSRLVARGGTMDAPGCAFAKAYPDKADSLFSNHWNTWFTEDDVKQLEVPGINTVRIPLSYWIVKPLVDRNSEFYPRGGFAQLIRGVKLLRDSMRASSPFWNNMGHPESKFLINHLPTRNKYHRALIWGAVLSTFVHLISEFSNVVAIEAVNEPIMDAALTPEYGIFQQHFVEVIRAVEHSLGLSVPELNTPKPSSSLSIAAAFQETISQNVYNAEVRSVLQDSISVLQDMGSTFNIRGSLNSISNSTKSPLTTAFMDYHWQYDRASNPAAVAIGPQMYDNHLYLSFGNVTSPDPNSYLSCICNLSRIPRDTKAGDIPLVFGGWSLSIEFSATDAFLRQYADAQKLAYSRGRGWIFWNFKVMGSEGRQWSYLEGLSRGFFTKDPASFNDPSLPRLLASGI